MYNQASDTWFNPALMARKYAVRHAIDDRGKRLAPPNVSILGKEIVVQNPRANYWDTMWSIGTPGYGPVVTGSFEKRQEEYWHLIKLPDLGPAEVREVTKLYDSYRYVDVGNDPKMKLKKADWKKLFSKRKFIDTQDMDSKLANAAYQLVRAKNSYQYPDDEQMEQAIWDGIQGIYSRTKKGDKITFIIKK
jgi:hypothetical protein